MVLLAESKLLILIPVYNDRFRLVKYRPAASGQQHQVNSGYTLQEDRKLLNRPL